MNERKSENRIETYPHWEAGDRIPALPKGRIERLYTHWSAHDYESVFPAYHFCIAATPDGRILVVNTHDVRENMRDISHSPDRPYAAHTRGRNSFALGLSMMAMQGATPHDFGEYGLTQPLIDGLCSVAAQLANIYEIPIDAEHIMSHAEAALHDGYFGAAEQQRWDIARLVAEARPLVSRDAIETGERLRERMRSFQTA
ncbi:MAG: hypothetical protein ACYDGM_06285 [Vulcanimicrobiaceae bacterium]